MKVFGFYNVVQYYYRQTTAIGYTSILYTQTQHYYISVDLQPENLYKSLWEHKLIIQKKSLKD